MFDIECRKLARDKDGFLLHLEDGMKRWPKFLLLMMDEENSFLYAPWRQLKADNRI